MLDFIKRFFINMFRIMCIGLCIGIITFLFFLFSEVYGIIYGMILLGTIVALIETIFN